MVTKDDMMKYLYNQRDNAECFFDQAVKDSDGYIFWQKRIQSIDAIINVILPLEL